MPLSSEQQMNISLYFNVKRLPTQFLPAESVARCRRLLADLTPGSGITSEKAIDRFYRLPVHVEAREGARQLS